MSRSSRLRITFVAVSVAMLSSCGQDEKTVDVGAGRPVTEPLRFAPPGTSTADRLGARPAPRMGGGDAPTPSLDWTAPAEWKELPAAPMREAGFEVGGDPSAQCTLAVFPGDTGGALANVNRWRGQMGLGPIDEAALAALPSRPLLGGDATLVELSGKFGGMGGSAAVEDAKFVGLMRRLPAVSVFVKLVGPAKVVDAEAPRFAAFCASIRMGGMHGSPHGASTPAATSSAPAATPAAPSTPLPEGVGEAGGLRWKWPAGWSASPTERPMRAATIVVADAPKTDVAVTVLAGDAGGLEANLNRWRGQMGQPPYTAAEIEALPRLDALGVKAVVMSTAGTFTSMDGDKASDQALLGAVIERGSEVVFVKATGPVPEIARLRPSFDAFVASLTPAGGAK